MESRLRQGSPHIIARIKEGMVVFDPRTLNDEEIGRIVEAIIQITEDRGQKTEKDRI